MFLLDTNIVSELMREKPSAAAETWLAATDVHLFYFSSISEAELRYGVEILPEGRRRDSLLLQIERTFQEAFDERILPFDSIAAKYYGVIAAKRRSAGRPTSKSCCQIAAIAKSRDLTLVTRNTRDFTDIGIQLVNPWD